MNPFINLKRLEFAVTYHCSSKCAHCFVDEGTKKRYPGHIGEAGAKIVKDVAALYNLESVMTFGGESLLYPEATCAIHRTATELGVPTRQIITNGLWTKDPDRIKEIATMVVDSGVNNILISIDAFHAPYISNEILKEVAHSFLDLGMKNLKWSPSWVKSPTDDNKYNHATKELLKEVEYLELPVGNGNIISPNGVAVKNLAEFMPSKLRYPVGKCADQPYTHNLDDIQSICIEPNGDISICPSFTIGNALNEDVSEIFKNYNPFQQKEMKCIVEQGMNGLLNLAREAEIQLELDGYYTICGMCKDIVAKIMDRKI